MKLDVPLLKQPLHFMPDQSAAPSWMTETLAKIKESAGFVSVGIEWKMIQKIGQGRWYCAIVLGRNDDKPSGL